jgi:hypothetical protein
MMIAQNRLTLNRNKKNRINKKKEEWNCQKFKRK